MQVGWECDRKEMHVGGCDSTGMRVGVVTGQKCRYSVRPDRKF